MLRFFVQSLETSADCSTCVNTQIFLLSAQAADQRDSKNLPRNLLGLVK